MCRGACSSYRQLVPTLINQARSALSRLPIQLLSHLPTARGVLSCHGHALIWEG